MKEIILNTKLEIEAVSEEIIKELDILHKDILSTYEKIDRCVDDKTLITKSKTKNTNSVKDMSTTLSLFKSKVDELVFGEINTKVSEINLDSTRLTALCKSRVDDIDNNRKDSYKAEATHIVNNNCFLYDIEPNDKIRELILYKTDINFNSLSNTIKQIEEGIPKVFVELKEDLDMFSISFTEYLKYDLNSKKYAAHLADLNKPKVETKSTPKEVDKVETRNILNTKPEGKRNTVLDVLRKDLIKTYTKLQDLDVNKQVIIDISLDIIKDIL
jgi:hypothetical protein